MRMLYAMMLYISEVSKIGENGITNLVESMTTILKLRSKTWKSRFSSVMWELHHW